MHSFDWRLPCHHCTYARECGAGCVITQHQKLGIANSKAVQVATLFNSFLFLVLNKTMVLTKENFERLFNSYESIIFILDLLHQMR